MNRPASVLPRTSARLRPHPPVAPPSLPTAPSERSAVPLPMSALGPRSYMPGLARFMSRVRLAEQIGDEHAYGYTIDNPMTYVDPDGLRSITPQDLAALKFLWNWNDPLILPHDKNAAINAIKTAIAAVPNGATDPVPLKAVLWGLTRLGDVRYGNIKDYKAGTRIPNFGNLPGLRGMSGLSPEQPKCNYFVGYTFGYAGGVGFGGTGGYPIHEGWHKSPIGADLLFSPNYNNQHLPIVQKAHLGMTPEPALGDIVSWKVGHTALGLGGGGLVLYAGPEFVKVQTMTYVETSFHASPHNVRRWK